jgi:uncharacterized protein YbbC (DUF1343 family)
MDPVRTGLEALATDPAVVGDRSWALLANHAAVSADLKHARTLLTEALPGRLIRLLAPEHGIDGIAQDITAPTPPAWSPDQSTSTTFGSSW